MFWNTLHIFPDFPQFLPKTRIRMNGRNTTLPPNQTERKPVETRNDSAMLSFRLLKITEATGGGGLQVRRKNSKKTTNGRRVRREAAAVAAVASFDKNVSNPRKFFQIFSPPHTQK